MKNFIIFIFVFTSLALPARSVGFNLARVDDPKSSLGKRGWMLKVGYNQQSSQKWVEVGVGRINIISTIEQKGNRSYSTGAAAFTFGSDIGFGDTSLIYSAKMGVEAHLTLFGARVTYGYYMQDNNASGVIGVEGGFCIFSVFYVYAGYNFVKGNQENPVVFEGGKLAVGINVPFGIRSAEKVKSIGG